ncbi:MAG: hypothetical protein ACKOI2_07830 [Actinomycetota bacterium]
MLIQAITITFCAMAIALFRSRSGLALIGDSGSYLAGASGISQGRLFDTPLVPSFSELPLVDTVRNSGWSPYADFGIGLPLVIALVHLVLPMNAAAVAVNVASIGLIALGFVIGPWSPRRHGELWMRSVIAIAVSCWPIVSFTATGVLSEPLFCAALLWLAILLSRLDVGRTVSLVVLGALTVVIGTLRFVGPIVAIIVAILLLQRRVVPRRVAAWTAITVLGPLVATWLAAGNTNTRVLAMHGLDSSDVFFTARGVGGWFEATLGDQTSTLFRSNFDPTIFDWAITIAAVAGAVAVLVRWATSIRQRSAPPLEPARVLAVGLALAVVPSMVFIDAVLKLENRILMPTGLLVISATGWWIAERSQSAISPRMNTSRLVSWSFVGLWIIVATHPWQWLDRPPAAQSTPLTETVRSLNPSYVVTNRADLVWWTTHIPARYLPDGYHDLSDRTFDTRPIMQSLPCELERTGGVIVIEDGGTIGAVADQLQVDTANGSYTKSTRPDGIVVYTPTGLDC